MAITFMSSAKSIGWEGFFMILINRLHKQEKEGDQVSNPEGRHI